MKKINLIWSVLFLLLLATSCKKINQKMIIERYICGEYLKCNKKYYSICNPEMISAYSDGEQITVTFRKVKKCPTPPPTYSDCIIDLFPDNRKFDVIEILEVK